MKVLRLCLVFAASSAPAQNLAPEQARLANVSQDFAAAMAKGEAACPRLSSRARRSAYQFEHADEKKIFVQLPTEARRATNMARTCV